MKYLVLAGGFATRLWPLTEKRAKPLLLLAGKTIVEHIFEKLPKDADIILLTNSAFEDDFKREMDRLGRPKVEIFCEDAESDGQKLGAVKALSLCLDEYNIDESVCVIAGDNILPGLDVSHMECVDHQAKVVVREVETYDEARKFGVIETRGNSGEVTSFIEKPADPKSKLVSTGFMSFGKQMISVVHDVAKTSPDSLGSIFTGFLCHDNDVRAVRVPGEWFDVGSFETYLQAHETLQDADVKRGNGCHDVGCVFSGKVFVGDNVQLENCVIHDSIIYPGTVIKNGHISKSVIDTNCVLTNVDVNQKLIRSNTKITGE